MKRINPLDTLPNSDDPDEMQRNAAFHLGPLFVKIKTTYMDRDAYIIIKNLVPVTPKNAKLAIS